MSRFKHLPISLPNVTTLSKSYYILCSAHDAASSFLDTFEHSRANRKATGSSTDEEQNLLRAMLVFASSGLDSMVKQLVRDTLPTVIKKDVGALAMFEGYIEKRIKKIEGLDFKFISKILANDNHHKILFQDLVDSICASSLQSKEQLLKVGAYFNIPYNKISKDLVLLDKIFSARNQIAHEMDVDFTQPGRRRRPRQKKIMIDYTDELFNISNSFLNEVKEKL